MVGKRSYDEGCAVAHGLDLIGERWALLVVRELLLGPKRFTDLRAGLPGVSADVLTQRLRELQQSGVVRRRKLAPPAGAWIYELTEWGAELEPVVTQLGRWSSRSPAMPHDAPIGADSVVLSLRALFDPRTASGLDTTVALHLDDNQFLARVRDGHLDVRRGAADQPDATLTTSPHTLAAVLSHRRDSIDAQRAGEVTVDGDAQAARRFLDLFPMPDPAHAVAVAGR
jgi:DNA-binding HxlR family transcriptional regulator/putative sterol carrier protein